METHTLKLFVAVAHATSFSAVAREHGVEPSSVSRAIAVLEGELGVRLFQRTTRKLTLTEAGALYLERIEGLAEQLGDARDEVQALGQTPAGTLRLSTSVAFGQTCIVPLLAGFRARFPGLALELLMNDFNADLVAERIDLAIRLAPAVEANVIAAKLIDTHYHVVASPAWLAAHRLATPDDLRQHNVLRYALPGYRDRWQFKTAQGLISEVPVAGDLIISSPLGLREAAIAGMGPALLADWLIGDDLRIGRLVDCFPDRAATATDFNTAAWVIYPSRQFLPNKVRVTIDFLKERLRRN